MIVQSELHKMLFDITKKFADYEGLKVAWPNREFKTDGLEIYLKPMLEPVEPEVLTVCGGGSKYVWFYQISIYVVKGHKRGEFAALEIADKLRTVFPVNKKLVGSENVFKVITPVNAKTSVVLTDWCFIPVDFRLQTIS